MPVSVGVGVPPPVGVGVPPVGVGVPPPVGVGVADVGDTLGDGDSDGDTDVLAVGEPPSVGHIDWVVPGYGWADDGTTAGLVPGGTRLVPPGVGPEAPCAELPVPDCAQPDVPLAPGTAAAPPADDVLVPVAPRVPLGEVAVPFPVGFPEPSVPADPFEEFPPLSTVELT